MTVDQKIRAAIKATLENIPGIGVVHGYERFSKDPKSFAGLYLNEGKLLGWHIRRLNIREAEYSTMYNRIIINWRIRGFAGLVDVAESELVFDNLVDAIRSAFRRLPLLCDLKGKDLAKIVNNGEAGVQVSSSEPVMFAGVLAHRVTLALTTEHLEEIEPRISDFAEVGESTKVENGQNGENVQIEPKPCPNEGAFSMNLCLSPGGEDFILETKDGETHE